MYEISGENPPDLPVQNPDPIVLKERLQLRLERLDHETGDPKREEQERGVALPPRQPEARPRLVRRLAQAALRPDRDKAGAAGFTLLEILIVVVIISILALVVVPNVLDRPDQARVARAKQDVRVVANALQLYRLDNLDYPTTEQGLNALVERPTSEPVPRNWANGGYIESLPEDPWGNPYQYLRPGVHGEFDVFSFGADGKAGGSDLDADIGNWEG